MLGAKEGAVECLGGLARLLRIGKRWERGRLLLLRSSVGARERWAGGAGLGDLGTRAMTSLDAILFPIAAFPSSLLSSLLRRLHSHPPMHPSSPSASLPTPPLRFSPTPLSPVAPHSSAHPLFQVDSSSWVLQRV